MQAQGTLLTSVAFALLAGWLGIAHAAPASIERIDPPNWWVGFHDPTLQLLVHGPAVASLTPSVDYPGVRLTGVTRTANPNYLFLTLQVGASALPGTLPLEFRGDSELLLRRDYQLEARRSGSRERQGFDAADVIYLAMPDRFANGDPSNDQPPGTLDHLDRKDGGARHGGDLAGLVQHIDFLAEMGFTQLWLTPVVENAQPAYSYHGYSITDHYRVDPRYGSNEDLQVLSRVAREHGVGLIADIVVNHIGSGHWWMRDLPDPAWLSGDGARPLTTHMRMSVQDPHGAEVDRRQFIDGWFDTAMPDLHPMFPPLGTYLIQNALWWIEYADLSGLRMDTYSYSDKRFMADFTHRVMAEYPNLNIVGEEFTGDPALVAYWQAGHVNADGYASGLPTSMDFPLRESLLAALTEPEQPGKGLGLVKVYQRLADDFVYAHPERMMVFADNHDTDRLYTQLGHDDALWRMAMTFIATTRGVPQILYGTEVLMANDKLGNDGDRRRDFPGGWAGDRADAFSGRGLAPSVAAAEGFLHTLLTWRHHAAAVQHGTLLHYAPLDGVYVYFRRQGADAVMVALNKNARATTLDLERFSEGLAGALTGVDIFTHARIDLAHSMTLAPRSTSVIELQ